MSDWPSLLRQPAKLRASDKLEGWFTRIAEQLLYGSRLMVGGQPYRLVEVEFYYWSKAHPDPFTHRDPIQFHIGHWYFHRTHGVYRGGSFKGLDLTFGDSDTSGGILIRGLETPNGALIDGPSLCVDHLLDATGAATVAELDQAINKRLAWEEENPLFLKHQETHDAQSWIRSPRVGLALRRVTSRTDSTRFLMRPYRYLSEPRRTKKGKPHMVLALHAQGKSTEDITQLTNCPQRIVERYIAEFEAGRKDADFSPYFGVYLTPAQLCRLYGVWSAHWGSSKR